MNGLDLAIVVIGVSLGLIGFLVGIIRIVVTVVGMVVGITLAGRLSGPVSGLLDNWISSPDLARVVAFGVIFLATLIAGFILSSIVKKVLSLLLLGWVDKVGGAALALVVGLGAVAALLAVLTRFPVGGVDKAIEASLLGSFLVDKFRLLIVLLPAEVSQFRR
jgi:membrane protein required for colicin V production